MLVYPQLASGALSQYPIQKRHKFRTLANVLADGTAIKLADAGAETIEWQLQYNGLSDAELSALMQFFESAEGSLNGFTFLDPTGNLLAWSDDLSNVVWDFGPVLSSTGGIADPANGDKGWHIVNSGAGAQVFSQTLPAPGGYVCCFSAYVKAATPTTLTLLLGANRYTQTVGASWRRLVCSGASDVAASSVTFGLELEAGAAIDVYGIQVEPQASPSRYKASTNGGCYENARLRDDSFSFTTTGVNCHTATVNLFYAIHL